MIDIGTSVGQDPTKRHCNLNTVDNILNTIKKRRKTFQTLTLEANPRISRVMSMICNLHQCKELVSKHIVNTNNNTKILFFTL